MTSIKDFTKRVFLSSKIMTAVAVTLIIVGIAMSGLFVAGWVDKQMKEDAPATTIPAQQQSSGQSSTTSATTSYTLAEIAQHNTSSDCWIIIIGSVYSVAQYLSEHPGGASAIIPYCGRDATTAFNQIARGQGHSSAASQIKASYQIGVVAQ